MTAHRRMDVRTKIQAIGARTGSFIKNLHPTLHLRESHPVLIGEARNGFACVRRPYMHGNARSCTRTITTEVHLCEVAH